jgi:hypothetical protein
VKLNLSYLSTSNDVHIITYNNRYLLQKYESISWLLILITLVIDHNEVPDDDLNYRSKHVPQFTLKLIPTPVVFTEDIPVLFVVLTVIT